MPPIIRAWCKQLDAWRKEANLHSGFHRKLGNHFTVLFEGPAEADLADRAVAILEGAYRRIGTALSTYPTGRITVVLYTREQFRDITQSPDWAGGAFDGRIRVPVQGALANPRRIRARAGARVHPRAGAQHRPPRRAVLARRRTCRSLRGQRTRGQTDAGAQRARPAAAPAARSFLRRALGQPTRRSPTRRAPSRCRRCSIRRAAPRSSACSKRSAAACRLPTRSSAQCSSCTRSFRRDSDPESADASTVPSS